MHPHSSSRLLIGSLGLVILVAVGCVPIPTGPTARGPEPRLRTSDPRERLPLPELDAFASPENPALDESAVDIRQAAFDAEFRPIGGGIEEVAAPTTVPDDFSEGLSLDDRVSLTRLGEGSEDRANPSIRFRPVSSDPGAGRTLAQKRDALLADLSTYRGRDERDLGDGERLAKHRVQMQLMALHFLRPDDAILLQPLIDSLAHPHEPSRAHSLLRASFYESVDLERESLAALSAIGLDGTGDAGTAATPRFRIAPPILCSRIFGLGSYREVGRDTFRPGTELRLYVEVYGITNGQVGEKYRQNLRIEFTLVDRDGNERGTQATRTEGGPAEEQVIDSFLNLRYSLPREIPFGAATLTITVTDLISGNVSKQRVPLQIEP